MRVYGSALLARKHIVTKRFGPRKWLELFDDMAARFPYFKQPVVAASIIPLAEFISFHDELVRRFFDGDPKAYFLLGDESARWAMTEGPYRSFVAGKDFEGIGLSFPQTWTMYFAETSSYCATRVDGNVVELEAFNLPVWHPYFEYFIVGYFRGMLDLICANPIDVTQLKGGGGTHYRYRLSTCSPEHLPDHPKPFVPVGAPSKLQRLTTFIEEHLTEEIEVDELARLVGYSADHLGRLFKRSFEMPLHQYVLQRRIERAKILLGNRNLPIGDVARGCGFASQSHFSLVFKQKVGLTPRAFRRGPTA